LKGPAAAADSVVIKRLFDKLSNFSKLFCRKNDSFDEATMDLTNPKVTDDDKIQLCKKYFICGFAFLPFLWAVNAVWFFREAFFRPSFPQQKTMKTYVVLSAIGSLFWCRRFKPIFLFVVIGAPIK
jgi:hypothetical protein